ncbi:MAG TPA: CHASE3 domain-containing protein [Polyangia bacterium]|jgi:CHASE3 domain sensor protein
MWTFGRKIAAGFALSFVVLAIIGVVAYRSIATLTATSYQVAHTHIIIEHISAVVDHLRDAETGQRGFVITGDEAFLEPYNAAAATLEQAVRELRELTANDPSQQARLGELEPAIAAKMGELRATIEQRRAGAVAEVTKHVQAGAGKRYMDQIRSIAGDMTGEERELLRQRAAEVESAASAARGTIIWGTLIGLVLVTLAGFAITRSLSSQIGSAISHVQSSSAELQAAANQQASGAKEQATAMSQITTTISELLATSRQIAESAKRVAQIAGETVGAARSGDQTMTRTHESVNAIKRQVDVIVSHMLELGKKSQQIGGILEIINELAEQTNILAINATIEAAGAGEVGKRFAVVADEIRKLADRVGSSTKEIRGLVDDIRSAVNTTVMATESGSKAVEVGTRQFEDVASSFKQIASLVTTTTEAAKEIEFSTKQQTTAVEQVNLAAVNVSQAARETEASSSQTLQTSSQLSSLSRDLGRLIRPSA